MSLKKKFFALTYDRQMAKVERHGLLERRTGLVPRATGDVLEIGAGTGANLAHYGPGVTSLTVTEPDPSMLRRLQRKVNDRGVTATILRAPAEDLPFDDESFDTVVATLVLCGVNDQQRALREIHRVLRPGGQFLFMEHVRSEDARHAHKQDRMNWACRLVAGCDCNRPTPASISNAGFDVTTLEHGEMPKAPSFVRPMVIGAALPIPGARFRESTAAVAANQPTNAS